MHGDLNGYNVLMTQRRDDVADYYLIDLAFYEEDAYLFFDHGYLELAYLLRAREHVGPGRHRLSRGRHRGDRERRRRGRGGCANGPG